MILIFAENGDTVTNSVIDWLDHFKANWIRLNEYDLVEVQSINLRNKEVNINLRFKSEYGFKLLGLNDVKGYWFRRMEPNFIFPTLENISSISNTINKNLLYNESRKVKEFIHSYLNQIKHINSIFDVNVNKLTSLLIARNVGLKVPDSLVTKKKVDLVNFNVNKERIITKGIYDNGCSLESNISAGCYTQLVDSGSIESFSEFFFPSFFQEYIDKEFEIRSFFLADRIYSMAIFSQNNEDTKIDFRNVSSLSKSLRTSPYKLPVPIEKKISRLMKELNMNCGSIDIVKAKNGDYYFLEVNPYGQFEFLSRPCNYQLEKKIAEYLISK
jgi:ATP-GRASP peptide maturase of grasp-with-spasm system